ncbi:MAG: zinc ribbon domain-containing protein [Methanoregula sp.]|jgi:hypothetical protein
MNNPSFQPGETIRIRSADVHVKFGRFVAFLTTQRIILVDPDDDLMPAKELSLASVAGTEPGETQKGEPVLCIFSRISRGEIRRLILTFARNTGTVRTGERDAWITEISRHSSTARPDPARPPVAFQKPAFPQPDDAPRPVPRPPVFPEPVCEPVPPRAGKPGTLPEVIIFPDARAIPVPPGPEKITGSMRDPGKPGVKSAGLVQPTQRYEARVEGSRPDTPDPSCPYSKRSFFFCMACGNRVPSGARFCNRCGSSVIPPNEEVVQSPWDFLRNPEGSPDLAARWGVSVSPASEAPAQAPAPASPRHRPVEYGPSGMNPAWPGNFPQPAGSSSPGAGFPVRQVALIAAIIIFAGVMIAAMSGIFSTGMFGSAASVDNNPGNLVSSDDTTGNSVTSDSSESSGSTGVVEDTGTLLSESGSTGSSGSSTSTTTTETSIPSTGTYVSVTSSGSWEGTYGAVPAVWAVKGSGDMVYKVDDTGDSGSVSAVFTKDDTTSDDLLVQLYKDGQLVRSGNTATPAGSVTLVAGA